MTELPSELILVAFTVTLAGIVLSALWPSVSMALLLSISILKVQLRLIAPALMEGFTYDMFVVSLAIVGALIHRIRQGGGWRLPVPAGFVVCWFLLCVMIWLRLPASRDFEYGYKKALIFSIFNTLTCLAVLLYATSFKDIRRLLRVFLVLGALALLGMLTMGQVDEQFGGTRRTFLGAHVFAVADTCVFGAITLFVLWLDRRRLWQLVAICLALPLFIYAIIGTGTRGAIFVPPLGLFVALWAYRRRFNIQAIFAVILAGTVTAWVLAKILSPDMLVRFESKHVEEGFFARIVLASDTLQGFRASPLIGNGTGDTSYQISRMKGAGAYPHNHLLEVASELGIVGLVPYVILFWYGFRAAWRLNRPELEAAGGKVVVVTVFSCFVYLTVLTFKTGSFSSSYQTYFFLTLTVACNQLLAREQRATVCAPATDETPSNWVRPALPHTGC